MVSGAEHGDFVGARWETSIHGDLDVPDLSPVRWRRTIYKSGTKWSELGMMGYNEENIRKRISPVSDSSGSLCTMGETGWVETPGGSNFHV